MLIFLPKKCFYLKHFFNLKIFFISKKLLVKIFFIFYSLLFLKSKLLKMFLLFKYLLKIKKKSLRINQKFLHSKENLSWQKFLFKKKDFSERIQTARKFKLQEKFFHSNCELSASLYQFFIDLFWDPIKKFIIFMSHDLSNCKNFALIKKRLVLCITFVRFFKGIFLF